MSRARVLCSVAAATWFVSSAGAARAADDDADLEVPAAPPPRSTPAPPTALPPPGSAAASTPAPTPPPPAPASPSLADLEARLRVLEAERDEARREKAAPPTSEEVRVVREPSLTGGFIGPLGLVFSGYVQGQFETNQVSEDQLQQGGTPLNQDRFLVRRARIRVDRAWKWASTAIELDGNTVRGAAFGIRRAEVSLVYRATEEGAPPYVRLTAGLSEIPFGFEMTDSARSRVFMERSLGSLALFPGEPDVGVRVSGGLGFFRYAIAALNGQPIDDRPGRLTGDPNAAKDVVARVGVDTKPHEKLRVAGGVSFLTGRGFHAGTDATKSTVIWRDLNQNESVDGGEISAIPGTAATPSENFSRFVFGADVEIALETRFGLTRIYGEAFAAQNADRGVFEADPVALGADLRETGYYVAFVQDVTRYGIVGFRTDFYDPNGDFLDSRVGKLVPANASIRTFSPLLGLVLPDRARLVVQYDFVRDALARDASGVPTDLKNDRLTLRLQGEL